MRTGIGALASWVASLSLSATGCLSLSTGTGTAGAAGADAGTYGDASASASPTLTGVTCGIEPTTGAVLCQGISACPGLLVDPDLFPDCGFRVRGSALDLECACNGALCPIGVPATCTQAQQLLQGQSELLVCQQLSEGRCVGGSGTSTGTGTSSSSCDRTCADSCANQPACLQMCGC